MKKLMTSYIRQVERLNKALYYVAGVFTILMSAIIIYQVISRFILKQSLPWSEELTRYIMVWTVFIGAALALRKGALIGVEAIAEKVPRKVKKIMKIIVSLISIGFFIFLINYGIEIATKVSVQTSPAMHIPMSWAYAAIPVGSFLMLLNAFLVLFELLLKKGDGQEWELY